MVPISTPRARFPDCRLFCSALRYSPGGQRVRAPGGPTGEWEPASRDGVQVSCQHRPPAFSSWAARIQAANQPGFPERRNHRAVLSGPGSNGSNRRVSPIQGHGHGAQNQGPLRNCLRPFVMVAKAPLILPASSQILNYAETPSLVLTVAQPHQSPNATLPAGLPLALRLCELTTNPRGAPARP